jgi:hypothetical protein
MRLRLFANDWPSGQCLTLVQKLIPATTLPPRECLDLATRLFAFQHKRANPALVELADSPSAEDLLATCNEFGISTERVPDGGNSSEPLSRGDTATTHMNGKEEEPIGGLQTLTQTFVHLYAALAYLSEQNVSWYRRSLVSALDVMGDHDYCRQTSVATPLALFERFIAEPQQ